MAAPSKSCTLDPLPTEVLKKLLPELLPYIIDMCYASLEQGSLPVSQLHAIITPRLKKAGADASDVQSYRPVSNITFIPNIVEKLVCLQLVSFLNSSDFYRVFNLHTGRDIQLRLQY